MGTIKNYFSSALVEMADNLCYESHLQNHDWRKNMMLVLVKENAAVEGKFSVWKESDDTLPTLCKNSLATMLSGSNDFARSRKI